MYLNGNCAPDADVGHPWHLAAILSSLALGQNTPILVPINNHFLSSKPSSKPQ